jgi:hypothetical protein
MDGLLHYGHPVSVPVHPLGYKGVACSLGLYFPEEPTARVILEALRESVRSGLIYLQRALTHGLTIEIPVEYYSVTWERKQFTSASKPGTIYLRGEGDHLLWFPLDGPTATTIVLGRATTAQLLQGSDTPPSLTLYTVPTRGPVSPLEF